MNDHIERQMKAKGYGKVKGMAILNDVAITVTSETKQVLSPRLSTKQAVDVFNNESDDGWDLYRLKITTELNTDKEQ